MPTPPDLSSARFATRAVHAGERLPPGSGVPVSSAIAPSVGYSHPSMQLTDAILGGGAPGYVYARYGTPSTLAFEQAVAALEAGPEGTAYPAAYGAAYASGMAAIHGALLAAGAQAGTSVVAALDLYGASYSLLNGLLRSLGVQTNFVDVRDLAALEQALRQARPAALLVETISNPLLKVADIERLAALAHAAGARLLVDNTFASPYLIQPLAHGADFVIHSATKVLSGHGDVLAGVVVCAGQGDHARLIEINKLVGGVLGPFEAWLALRGLKTLPLRFQRQCESALQIAAALQGQARILKVYYPALESHPDFELARRMFGGRGSGGVISFELAEAGGAPVGDGRPAGTAAAFRFMDALRLCQPATTLGDVYTLVLHPASASHRSLTPAERRRAGIPDNLLRLSCGIEDPQDILSDLLQALEA